MVTTGKSSLMIVCAGENFLVFYTLNETVDIEKMNMNPHAIHRVADFLGVYDNWAELGIIEHDLATEMAEVSVLAAVMILMR